MTVCPLSKSSHSFPWRLTCHVRCSQRTRTLQRGLAGLLVRGSWLQFGSTTSEFIGLPITQELWRSGHQGHTLWAFYLNIMQCKFYWEGRLDFTWHLKITYFLYLWVCVYLCVTLFPWRTEVGVGSPEAGVMDTCGMAAMVAALWKQWHRERRWSLSRP